MTLVVPNEGEAKMLTSIVTAENLTLKLFTNNVVPGETDTSASYTEAAGNGYAAQTLTNVVNGTTNWTVTAGTGSPGNSIASYPQQTFTFSGGPVSVYGYYVVGASSAKVYWAEAFSSVANIPSGGGSIKITPQLQLE